MSATSACADVAADLSRDLAEVRGRREESDALDDSFGGWFG